MSLLATACRLLVVVVAVAASATSAWSAPPATASAPAAERAAKIDYLAAAADPEGTSAAASGIPPEVAAADLKDLAAHVAWQRQFAKDSWSWHLFSTKMLMFVVLSIVAFGLLLTYIQFTRDGRSLRRAKGTPPSALAASTLKLSPAGVEITSQVIGLLVLGFSLAFFYLYVKDIYPIQEVELQRQAKSAAAAPTTPPAPR